MFIRRTEVTDPLDQNFFNDILDAQYDNIEKNEALYDEVHEQVRNNTPSGFSLGTSRTYSEIVENLSSIRSTTTANIKGLLDIKKTMADIALKKKSMDINTEQQGNDKEFARNIIVAVSSELHKAEQYRKDHKTESIPTVDSAKKKAEEMKDLDTLIDSKLEAGEISLTKNDKAMKYDFNGEVEILYDMSTSQFKPVKKGTTEIIEDYPIERANLGDFKRCEDGYAYTNNGKKIKAVPSI